MRLGTAGWYRAAAFEDLASVAGPNSATVLGDVFEDRTRARTAEAVARILGRVDLLLYSIAAPRRRDPRTGRTYISAIRTVGEPFTARGYDVASRRVHDTTMTAATPAEVADTVKVMGGEDWQWWVEALSAAGVLADGVRTVALSYDGPPELRATYRGGTLGAAKDDLERRASYIGAGLASRHGGTASVAVLPAMTTTSSVVMPTGVLYTMLLDRETRAWGTHQDVLDAGRTLLDAVLAVDPLTDDRGRLRLDNHEWDPPVRAAVSDALAHWSNAELEAALDRDAFHAQLGALYGFGVEGVDYDAEVTADVPVSERILR